MYAVIGINKVEIRDFLRWKFIFVLLPKIDKLIENEVNGTREV
jgi:hypothetical protein